MDFFCVLKCDQDWERLERASSFNFLSVELLCCWVDAISVPENLVLCWRWQIQLEHKCSIQLPTSTVLFPPFYILTSSSRCVLKSHFFEINIQIVEIYCIAIENENFPFPSLIYSCSLMSLIYFFPFNTSNGFGIEFMSLILSIWKLNFSSSCQ